MAPFSWFMIGFVTFSTLVARIVYRCYFHPLSNIPGPVLASFTRLWMLWHAVQGKQHISHLEVHKRYGPIVRVGPNHILLSNPEHGAWYYSLDKSNWWYCFRPNDQHLAFSTELSLAIHNMKKKRVAGAYSLTSLLMNEATMDMQISAFVKQLKTFSENGQVIDMGSWMTYLNFDILMDMVFSNPPGFIKEGKDVKSLIAANHTFMKMAQVIGIFPMIYKIMQLPFISQFGPKPTDEEGAGLLFGIVQGAVQSRLRECKDRNAANSNSGLKRDMLQTMVDYRDSEGHPIPPGDLNNEALVAIASGVDTTSCILQAAILHISKTPDVREKLVKEINAASAIGALSTPVKYNEARKLEYLGAVIQEAIRIHPPTASPFWRTSPTAGKEIEGHFIPHGIHIGINEWTISRNKQIYGDDVDIYKPERWLNCDDGTKNMRDYLDLLFGYGPYMCLGRNFAMMQLYKVIVEVFRDFEIEVLNPKHPWKSRAAISFVHSDFNCAVRQKK